MAHEVDYIDKWRPKTLTVPFKITWWNTTTIIFETITFYGKISIQYFWQVTVEIYEMKTFTIWRNEQNYDQI